MLVYSFLIEICLIVGFLLDKGKTKKGKDYLLVALIPFILLFLVSAIRFDVGTDFKDTYVYTFNLVLNKSQNIRFDFLPLWLDKILVFLHANVQWFFIITSFVMNWYIFRSIMTQSNNKMLSYYIYICGTLYFFSMNGIRQSIVIGIFYYTFRFIQEKKLGKYLIYNLIGCLIHSSAILFLPLYFILNKKIKSSLKIISLIVISGSMAIILPIISNILLQTKHAMYITNGAYSALENINLSTVLNFLIFLIYEFVIDQDPKDRIYANCHYIGVISSLFLTSLPLTMRIFMAFRYVEFLSIPNLIEKLRIGKTSKKIIMALVIVFYFIYFIHGVYLENGNGVLPYKTFFSAI